MTITKHIKDDLFETLLILHKMFLFMDFINRLVQHSLLMTQLYISDKAKAWIQLNVYF